MSNDLKACWPKAVTRTEIVAVDRTQTPFKKVTAEEELHRIKARCAKDKLVSSNGKQIQFYRLEGCWGNPPTDYREILERQGREIARLRKKFTLIEIPCDVSGDPRQIS